MTKDIEDKIILEAIDNNPLSMRQAAIFADISYSTFVRKAKRLGVYKPNPGGKGTIKLGCRNKGFPLHEILEGKHPQYQTNHLRHRLLREGLKENKCECCEIDSWNDKPITIQLDHIDGVSTNHKFENLRMLCANCHSQTSTFSGRNKKKLPVVL